MLFNSIDFAIFLPIVFAIYWIIGKSRTQLQNAFVLLASYIFYGWWDWRFLSLIVFSSGLDYIIGRSFLNVENASKRKALLLTSILVNLGFLGFFKYFNFFTENFVEAFTFFGGQMEASRLSIVLPVGISFYTFQTLSYSIDVFNRKMKPTKDPIAFFAYVSFFPQLVAGPIERASHLLPQFIKERQFQYHQAVDGMRQILWGLFKKVVIADNCAIYVNQVFNNTEDFSGYRLLIGVVFFAFQIYGDFSGYSDIAIGTSRLFGFHLMRNFAFPYFSRDIAEFWRRWHISLSTWFRDYLYIPLGGSRGSLWIKVRNVMIIFIVSGFWHGANWTFIVWGALNAIYFLPLLLIEKNRSHLEIVAHDSYFPSLKEAFNMLGTFLITCFAWIFFRAESIAHALQYISKMFYGFQKNPAQIFNFPFWVYYQPIIYILILFIMIEWFGRKGQYAIQNINTIEMGIVGRWAFYCVLALFIAYYGDNQQEFIYFQF